MLISSRPGAFLGSVSIPHLPAGALPKHMIVPAISGSLCSA